LVVDLSAFEPGNGSEAEAFWRSPKSLEEFLLNSIGGNKSSEPPSDLCEYEQQVKTFGSIRNWISSRLYHGGNE
jgi:hypothetical protein